MTPVVFEADDISAFEPAIATLPFSAGQRCPILLRHDQPLPEGFVFPRVFPDQGKERVLSIRVYLYKLYIRLKKDKNSTSGVHQPRI